MAHRKSRLVSADDGECTIEMHREYSEHPLYKQVLVFGPFALCERLAMMWCDWRRGNRIGRRLVCLYHTDAIPHMNL